MNDSAFQIAFSCRHLLHLVDITKPCPGCGRRVLDRFGQHLFHESEKWADLKTYTTIKLLGWNF
jgi:hypothetical protein